MWLPSLIGGLAVAAVYVYAVLEINSSKWDDSSHEDDIDLYDEVM